VITTHVLDTARGVPAAGVPIRLERWKGVAWQPLGSGCTDGDGRLRTLTPAGPVEPGRYRISFDTAAYFAAMAAPKPSSGAAPTAVEAGLAFFPLVVVDGAAHYHVPLLLSPFGYSTYRGS
jgi:hydroxyisourate hydrolase